MSHSAVQYVSHLAGGCFPANLLAFIRLRAPGWWNKMNWRTICICSLSFSYKSAVFSFCCFWKWKYFSTVNLFCFPSVYRFSYLLNQNSLLLLNQAFNFLADFMLSEGHRHQSKCCWYHFSIATTLCIDTTLIMISKSDAAYLHKTVQITTTRTFHSVLAFRLVCRVVKENQTVPTFW